MNGMAQSIRQIANNLKLFAGELKDTVDDVIRDTFEDVAYDLDLEFSHCVDAFYEEYSPVYYRRTYALYEGYKIDRGNNGLSINWETDGSLIPDWHRESPQYIFDLTYIKGQHGGGINNGLYRNGFEGWGDPAEPGVPIDKRIMESFNTYKKSKKMQKYFDHYFDVKISNLKHKYGLQGLF